MTHTEEQPKKTRKQKEVSPDSLIKGLAKFAEDIRRERARAKVEQKRLPNIMMTRARHLTEIFLDGLIRQENLTDDERAFIKDQFHILRRKG